MCSQEKKESKRPYSFNFLNLKLLHNQTPENYVNLFMRLLNENYVVKGKGNIELELADFYKSKTASTYIGKLVSYESRELIPIYDKITKEIVQTENHSYLNPKETLFYLVPDRHRIALRCNAEVSLSNLKLFIESASARLLGAEQLHVSVETSTDFIEDIRKAKEVNKISVSWSYTNKDLIDGFAGALDEASKKGNIAKVTTIVESAPDESLDLTEEGLPNAILQMSLSNSDGAAFASVADPTYTKTGKVKRLNRKRLFTSSYSLREMITYVPSQAAQAIYDFVMTRFRNSDEHEH